MVHALWWWRSKPMPSLAACIADLERLTPEAERDGVAAKLATVVVGGNSVKTLRNVEALADLAADPRLTDFFTTLVGAPPFDVSAGNPAVLMHEVARLLVRQPDARVAPWCRELPTFLASRKGSRPGQLSFDEIATLTSHFKPLRPVGFEPFTAADEKAVESFRRALAPMLETIDRDANAGAQLLSAVVERFDDAAIGVYGDWLSERGLPQGELISRMCAGETKGLEALQQRARPSCFGGGRLRWEKGFPVEALFADRDGIRAASWGPELEWGTLRVTDVVPASDACHAEQLDTLHVGPSFVADLAKRTKPVSVKTLGLLSLSPSTRPAWKKVQALNAVETVVVRSLVSPADLTWFLATPVGRGVKRVELTHPSSKAEVLQAVAGWFDGAAVLETVTCGDAITLRRGECEVTLESAAKVEQLVRELAPVPVASFERVVLVGPTRLTAEPKLRALGRTVSAREGASAVATLAAVERAGEKLVITPHEGDAFDAAALEGVLAGGSANEVEVVRAVDLRQTAAMWRLARDAKAAQLTVSRLSGDRWVESGPHAFWYGAPLKLTVTKRALRCEAGRGTAPLLDAALDGLPRVSEGVLKVGGGLSASEVEGLTRALRRVADAVRVERADASSLLVTKYVKSRKRLEVREKNRTGDAGPLTPAVLDELLTKQAKVTDVVVFQRDVELMPWLDWVRARHLTLEFRVPWQLPEYPIRLSFDEGLVVSVSLRRELEKTLPAQLLSAPPRSIARLELVHHSAVPDAWRQAAKHVAVKWTVATP